MTLKGFEAYSPAIQRELERLGFTEATPIQEAAFQPIMEGLNVLLLAPTGSGKTEAAVLPVFEAYLRLRGKGWNPPGIKILYITPLRALNRDILRRLAELGRRLGISVEVRHGDTPASARRIQSMKPPDMLITTPETLQAILPGKRMREHLRAVRWVIVDEVHELACDKRGVQLTLALERLRRLTGLDFQRIGLSATLGKPEEAGRFLSGRNRRLKIVEAESLRRLEAQVESPSPSDEDLSKAEGAMLPAGTVARLRRLVEAAETRRSTLVFTNTREHAEALASNLRLLYPELPLAVHHGSLSREVRVEAEEKLKAGKLKLLVCTSSLELGIDVGAIDLVVQYHSPRQAVRLAQRIGRSGHRLGGVARGLILAAWPDDILEAAVLLRRVLSGELEAPTIHRGALDVLAHQLAGLTLDHGSISLEEALKIFREAEAYSELPAEEFYSVAAQLDAEGKIRLLNGILRVRVPETYRYYFENLSMIPEVSSFLVVDYAGRKVGSLDQEFVAKHGKPGSLFILKGSVWRILRVDEDRKLVEVEASEPSVAAIPAWEGEMIPVTFEAALEVAKLRRLIAEDLEAGGGGFKPLEGYPLSWEAKVKVVSAVREHVEAGFPIPSDRLVLVEPFENYLVIHVCLGDRGNRALSRVLAALVTARVGVEIAVQSDPYRIALVSPRPLDPYMVVRELKALRVEDVRGLLEATLEQTELFNWRLWNNAKRFGVVSREAEYRLRDAQMLLKALKETPVYRETLREIFLEDLDLEAVSWLISAVRAGEVRVEVSPFKAEPSPLALPLLDKIAPHDLLRPAAEQGEVLEVLKHRIASKTVRLLCAYKGDWETIRRVENVPEKPRCPRCGSTLIAVLNPQDLEALKAVKRKLSGKKLTKEEEKLWLNVWRSASLVQNYGKKAVMVLAARGVGPATAVRILRQPFRGEDELYQAILKAEREYLRTKPFWD